MTLAERLRALAHGLPDGGVLQLDRAALLRMLADADPDPDGQTRPKSPEPDTMLTVSQAAERLGVDVRWIYRRRDRLPWLKRISPRTLRASSQGLERWLVRRNAADM